MHRSKESVPSEKSIPLFRPVAAHRIFSFLQVDLRAEHFFLDTKSQYNYIIAIL